MTIGTFSQFCKHHKIDVAEFTDLRPVMWELYVKHRACQTVTTKTVDQAIKEEKRRLADQHQAHDYPLASLVQSDIRASRKVMRS